MRWCRFQTDGKTSYGIVDGNRVQPVAGTPFTRYRRISSLIQVSQIRFLPPVIPPTFYAAGINYRDHVMKMAQITGQPGQIPSSAEIGYRAQSALVAHNEPIRVPHDASD